MNGFDSIPVKLSALILILYNSDMSRVIYFQFLNIFIVEYLS